MQTVTAQDVIKKRQRALIDRNHELIEEATQIRRRLEEIERERLEIEIEHKILDRAEGRREVVSLGDDGATHTVFSKLKFEDVLKTIVENAGRPVRVGEIIAELETFDFVFGTYAAAYSKIINSDVLIKVPQTRGYFQVLR